MRYASPQLRSLLAAEYVLGTLRGAARRRFERLCREDTAFGAERVYWEGRLGVLGLKLAPVTPPARVWTRIESHIASDKAVERRPRRPLMERAGFWQTLAAAASIAAISLGIAFRLAPTPVMPAHGYVAVVADAQNKPMWLVTADSRSGMLKCKAIGTHSMPAGKDMELWLVMKGDPKPVSLGTLPREHSMEMKLKPKMMPMLEHGIAVAVSMEPAGGSPTGQPTGPVMYQAALVQS